MSWINIKHKLPAAHEAVLAYCEIGGFPHIFEALCLKFAGWSHITIAGNVEKLPGVTHWMPLPALPASPEATCWINPDYELPRPGEIVIAICFKGDGEGNQHHKVVDAWLDNEGVWKYRTDIPISHMSWTGHATTCLHPGVRELKDVQYWMRKS